MSSTGKVPTSSATSSGRAVFSFHTGGGASDGDDHDHEEAAGSKNSKSSNKAQSSSSSTWVTSKLGRSVPKAKLERQRMASAASKQQEPPPTDSRSQGGFGGSAAFAPSSSQDQQHGSQQPSWGGFPNNASRESTLSAATAFGGRGGVEGGPPTEGFRSQQQQRENPPSVFGGAISEKGPSGVTTQNSVFGSSSAKGQGLVGHGVLGHAQEVHKDDDEVELLESELEQAVNRVRDLTSQLEEAKRRRHLRAEEAAKKKTLEEEQEEERRIAEEAAANNKTTKKSQFSFGGTTSSSSSSTGFGWCKPKNNDNSGSGSTGGNFSGPTSAADDRKSKSFKGSRTKIGEGGIVDPSSTKKPASTTASWGAARSSTWTGGNFETKLGAGVGHLDASYEKPAKPASTSWGAAIGANSGSGDTDSTAAAADGGQSSLMPAKLKKKEPSPSLTHAKVLYQRELGLEETLVVHHGEEREEGADGEPSLARQRDDIKVWKKVNCYQGSDDGDQCGPADSHRTYLPVLRHFTPNPVGVAPVFWEGWLNCWTEPWSSRNQRRATTAEKCQKPGHSPQTASSNKKLLVTPTATYTTVQEAHGRCWAELFTNYPGDVALGVCFYRRLHLRWDNHHDLLLHHNLSNYHRELLPGGIADIRPVMCQAQSADMAATAYGLHWWWMLFGAVTQQQLDLIKLVLDPANKISLGDQEPFIIVKHAARCGAHRSLHLLLSDEKTRAAAALRLDGNLPAVNDAGDGDPIFVLLQELLEVAQGSETVNVLLPHVCQAEERKNLARKKVLKDSPPHRDNDDFLRGIEPFHFICLRQAVARVTQYGSVSAARALVENGAPFMTPEMVHQSHKKKDAAAGGAEHLGILPLAVMSHGVGMVKFWLKEVLCRFGGVDSGPPESKKTLPCIDIGTGPNREYTALRHAVTWGKNSHPVSDPHGSEDFNNEEQIGILRLLLEYGADVNHPEYPPLPCALRYNAPSRVIKYLIEQGAKVEANMLEVGVNPVRNRHLSCETIEVLLDAGASVTSCSLNSAVASGSLRFLSLVLSDLTPQRQAEIEKCFVGGFNHSRWPTEADRFAVTNTLLLAGASAKRPFLSFGGEQNSTPLHKVGDDLEVAKLLVSSGCDPKVTTSMGRSALHEAAKGGHLKVIEYLLSDEIGLDPLAADKAGKTPKDEAASGGFRMPVVALFAKCNKRE